MDTSSGENKAVGHRIPVLRKAVYAVAAAAAFFILAEIILFLAGVEPLCRNVDPYVGFAPNMPLFVEQTAAGGSRYLATAENKLAFFNPQRFAAEKPPDTYRIFCLGGSVTYGRPYDDTTSFCGWLRALLPAADRSRNWEVINAGGISYASYRVAMVMREVAQCQPDLFVIYSGHNEFLEERTYGEIAGMPETLRRLGAALGRVRLYSLAARIAGREPGGGAVLGSEVEAMLDKTVGPESYQRDDRLRERIIEHYRFNLERMVGIAKGAGADVILVVPASNLKDCRPFKSQNADGLAPEELAAFNRLTASAAELMDRGSLGESLAAADSALAVDGRHADALYLRGGILWLLGRYGEAKAVFTQARDEDVCPLRALSPMGDTVRDSARELGVMAVDFDRLAAEMSPHSTAGAEIFLDHVHPTIVTNRRLAFAIMQAMAGGGIMQAAGRWDRGSIDEAVKAVEGSIDRRDHGVALRNLSKVLAWAGKFEEAERIARRALKIFPEDAETLNNLGVMLYHRGRYPEATEMLRHAAGAKPGYAEARYNLGRCLQETGDLEGAEAAYTEAVRLRGGYIAARFNLATVLKLQGRLDDAADCYRRILEIEADHADALNNLGSIYLVKERFVDAVDCFRRLLKIDPADARARYNLGLALLSMGRTQEAALQFRTALQLKPGYKLAAEALKRIEAGEGAP